MLQRIKAIHNFLIRFFEPAWSRPRQVMKSLFEPFYSGIWADFLPFLIMPMFMNYIAVGATDKLVQLSIYFMVLYVILLCVQYFFRTWFYSGLYTFEEVIEEKCRANLLLKDNASIERFGTGQVESIVSSGVFAWSIMLNDSFWYISRISITIFSGIYFSISLGYMYLFLFMIFIIAMIAVFTFYKLKEMVVDTAVN
jgi:ABC-type multidrug transport system fused ATPase/permease subunit